tara:strand:+ start:6994 stop:8526 length:1533 start_codon:yes stop_codon:yes gene_type:complete
MTNETYLKIQNYLKRLDKAGIYVEMPEFLGNINRNFDLQFNVGGQIKSVTLSEFLSNLKIKDGVVESIQDIGYQAPGTTSQETSDAIFYTTIASMLDAETYNQLLGGTDLNIVNWDAYTTALENLFNSLSISTTDTQGNQVQLLVGDEESDENAFSNLNKIRERVIEWETETVTTPDGTRTYTASQPKIGNIVGTPSEVVTDEGEVVFGSKIFYTGPNVAVNTANQYFDPITGKPKVDSEGNILQPHFKRGSAVMVFEGLTQDAIFEIQQDLMNAGMIDISSYNFVPGVVDLVAGPEIAAIARLMMMANDSIVAFPNTPYINKNAASLYGQLKPYVEFQKNVQEMVGVDYGIEGLDEFYKEILPPTESEVKAVVDELFIEKGINPTAADYQKYADIFGNLRKQAAARDIEIQQNKPNVNQSIGMAQTLSEIAQEQRNYVYPGFGVVAPKPEEVREKFDMPLLQPIDPIFELSKIIDDIEEGRIDASSEIRARSAAAAEFKRNFMVFEENF